MKWPHTQQVVRQATGHTVGIQKDPKAPIIFIHVDDLKLCPAPRETQWTPGPSTAKSLCASTVAFRPGSHISETESAPSVTMSTCKNLSSSSNYSDLHLDLDDPIDLTDHVLSPFAVRDFHYQDCHFHSISHLIRKWSRHLTENFPLFALSQTIGKRYPEGNIQPPLS